MNILLKTAAALAVAGATATAVDAAFVTNTYSVTSTFDQGPEKSITQRFTLEFDPMSD